MKRFLLFLPFAIAIVIGGFAVWGLSSDRDPRGIPSVLIAQPAPEFDLPPVPGMDVPGLARTDLAAGNGPVLVNFFASWCVACKAEHAVLSRLTREKGVTIYGINYKDKAVEATRWLTDLGNPYARIGFDLPGRAGIEWGISGVPETFVVDAGGTVVHRHVGPILGPEAQAEVLEALRQAALPKVAS